MKIDCKQSSETDATKVRQFLTRNLDVFFDGNATSMPSTNLLAPVIETVYHEPFTMHSFYVPIAMIDDVYELAQEMLRLGDCSTSDIRVFTARTVPTKIKQSDGGKQLKNGGGLRRVNSIVKPVAY